MGVSRQIKNFVWMMGPLHIEMALLKTIGDWLEGSGWLGVFNKAKISTLGRIDSFFLGSHVKKSRYALRSMAEELFQESGCSSYEDWENQLKVNQ